MQRQQQSAHPFSMVKFSRNYASKIDLPEKEYYEYDRLKKLIHLLNNEADYNPEEGNSAASDLLLAPQRIFSALNKSGLFRRVQQELPTSYDDIRKVFLDEFFAAVRRVDNFYVAHLTSVSTQLDYLTLRLDDGGFGTPVASGAKGGGAAGGAAVNNDSSVSSSFRQRSKEGPSSSTPPRGNQSEKMTKTSHASSNYEYVRESNYVATPTADAAVSDSDEDDADTMIHIKTHTELLQSSSTRSQASSPKSHPGQDAGKPSSEHGGGAAADGVLGLVVPKPLPEDKKIAKARLYSMKRSLAAIFADIEKLEGFHLVNTTAFLKSLKKFDKVHAHRRHSAEMEQRGIGGDGTLSPFGGARSFQAQFVSVYEEAMGRLSGSSTPGAPSYSISSAASIQEVRERAELLFAENFCKGDVQEAANKLRLGKGEDSVESRVYVNFKTGILVTMICWFLFDIASRNAYREYIWTNPSIYAFGFVGNLLFYRWFWAMTVQAWESAHVNFILLLQMSAKNTPGNSSEYEDAIDMSIGYLVCFILYLDSLRDPSGMLFGAIPSWVFLVLLVPLVTLPYFHGHFFAREYHGIFSLKVIYRLLTPWNGSGLLERYAGDMLCSFSRELSLLVFTSCYLFSGSFIHPDQNMADYGNCNMVDMQYCAAAMSLLPFIIRLLQTLKRQYDEGSTQVFAWPHGHNTIKYAGSLLIILLGTFQKVTDGSSTAYTAYFVLLCLAITAFQSWFDVVVDWGLGRVSPTSWFNALFSGNEKLPDKVFLRERLMYTTNFSRHGFYYFVLVANPILRLLWTLSLLPADSAIGQWVNRISPFLCVIELFRRFLWSCLKMEWDHIQQSTEWYGESLQAFRSRAIEKGLAYTSVVSHDTVPFHFGQSSSNHSSESTVKWPRYVVALGSVSCMFMGLSWIVGLILNAQI